MSEGRIDGINEEYVGLTEALTYSMTQWYKDEIASLDKKRAEHMPATTGDPLRDALVYRDPFEDEAAEIGVSAANRFISALRKGALRASYFDVSRNIHHLDQGFWLAPYATEDLLSGAYYPKGRPVGLLGMALLPKYDLFVEKSKLEGFLLGAEANTTRRPPSKVSIDQSLAKIADGKKTEKECRAEVEAQIGHVTDRMWRPAFGKLPAGKKRSPGANNRSDRAR